MWTKESWCKKVRMGRSKDIEDSILFPQREQILVTDVQNSELFAPFIKVPRSLLAPSFAHILVLRVPGTGLHN